MDSFDCHIMESDSHAKLESIYFCTRQKVPIVNSVVENMRNFNLKPPPSTIYTLHATLNELV